MRMKFNIAAFENTTLALENLDRNEATTIVFALKQYSDDLEKDLQKAFEMLHKGNRKEHNRAVEDIMFLTELLHRTHKVLFGILADHEHAGHHTFESWLDVI